MTDRSWEILESQIQRQKSATHFFETSATDEALSRLLFLVEDHRRCGVLFGPPGCGKSMLLERCSRLLRHSHREIAAVDAHNRTGSEVLWDLSGELGLSPRYSEDVFVLRRRLVDHLKAQRGHDFPTVLIIDHADQGNQECTEVIARLVQLAQHTSGTTILLSVRAFGIEEVPVHLREATELRVELGWFDRDDAERFIQQFYYLERSSIPNFDEAAVDQLLALSRGSPRVLSQLCDLSSLAALAAGEKMVTGRTVLSAAEDLQFVGYRAATDRVNQSVACRNTSVDV